MQDILIKGGMLIDGVKDIAYENPGILVRNGRIDKVGIADVPGAKVIDASGKFVMPGMIDCHVHLGTYAEKAWEFDLKPLEYATLIGIRDAQMTMDMGFTTLRCMGSGGYLEVSIREAFKNGLFQGPRILASGRFVTVTGGMMDWNPSWQTTTQDRGARGDGPVELLKIVRELGKQGVDLIKFEAAGASPSPYCPPEKTTMNFEEMTTIVNEAHRQELPVAAHTESTLSIIDCARAGADTLEHGIFMTEEAAKIVAENGCYYVPTLSIGRKRKAKIDSGKAEDLSDLLISRVEYIVKNNTQSVLNARDAGVTIALGTDQQYGTGVGVGAFEMACYTDFCGFTSMEAIKAGTSIAAKAIGLENEIGSIREGFCADILVIDKDPAEDVHTLQEKDNFRVILRGGEEYKNNL